LRVTFSRYDSCSISNLAAARYFTVLLVRSQVGAADAVRGSGWEWSVPRFWWGRYAPRAFRRCRVLTAVLLRFCQQPAEPRLLLCLRDTPVNGLAVA